jgi:hypothetical protein
VVVLLGLVGLLASPAAAADRPDTATAQAASDLVAVAVDSLSPVAPRPGDTLVVSGTLTNQGTTELRTVAVRLRLSPRPLENRAEIARIVDGRTERTGNALWNTQLTLASELEPGDSVPSEFSRSVDSLGLSTTEAEVAIISVEALGDIVVGDGIGAERVGLTTTFLPWFPDPDAVTPTRVVWLWPLTDPPARDAQDTLLDTSTGESVSFGGRLQTLLTLAAHSPVPLTYLLDPALLETLREMSGDYVVRDGSGTAPGTASAAAQSWLSQLQSVLSRPGSQTAALPYALPDLVAMHRAGLDLDLTQAVTEATDRTDSLLRADPAAGQPATPAVTTAMPWPADGVVDSGTLDQLRATGAHTVLLSSAMLPLEQRSAVTPDGVASLDDDDRFVAVLADNRLTDALAMPTDTVSNALIARQRLLAEVAATTLEAPTTPRTIVAAPPPTWSPDPDTTQVWLDALASSPWMRAAPLSSLLDLPAATGDGPTRRQADYRRRYRRAELPRTYLQRVVAARSALGAFRSVTSNAPEPTANAVEDALARSESQLWRSDLSTGRALLTSTSRTLDDLVSRVRVVSRGTTTFPGESGVVPVVVANDLDHPVRVAVSLTGTPAVRFDADPYPAFVVAGGTKGSVEIPAKVVGSGDVTVQVQLTTSDGRPYGTPATLVVRSTAYARAAGWVVGGLLALLVALLAVNFVRRRRPRAPSAPPAADTTTVGTPQ